MDTSSPPSFQALYKQYIEAFNAHSWEDVKACLSPDIEIYVRGKLSVKDDWDQLKKNYMEHWALPNAWVEIPELEEFASGVIVKVLDHARDHILGITYTYALQEGKWLQVKHEINTVTSATEIQDNAAETKATE
jgi:hypothetical protein